MKIRKSNYSYKFAYVVFYLRYEAPDKAIFNDRICINKRCKPLRVYNNYPGRFSLKIYKNTTLDFKSLKHGKFKGFCSDIALSII